MQQNIFKKDKPFDWRDVFTIPPFDPPDVVVIRDSELDQSLNDSEKDVQRRSLRINKIEAIEAEYDAHRAIIEAILDYEFGDKDGDGKIDSLHNREMMEKLQTAITFAENSDTYQWVGGKIPIYVQDPDPFDGIQSHARGVYYHDPEIYIDINGTKEGGVIDIDTGYVSPMSLNLVLLHEIDHLFDDVRHKKLARHQHLHDKKAPDEQDAFNRSFARKHPEITKEISDHANEAESMAVEPYIADLHGEPIRSSYMLTTTLLPEYMPSNAIYYTSDNDRYAYPHMGKQRVKEFDIRAKISKQQSEDSRYGSEKDAEFWIKELGEAHHHLKANNLYASPKEELRQL